MAVTGGHPVMSVLVSWPISNTLPSDPDMLFTSSPLWRPCQRKSMILNKAGNPLTQTCRCIGRQNVLDITHYKSHFISQTFIQRHGDFLRILHRTAERSILVNKVIVVGNGRHFRLSYKSMAIVKNNNVVYDNRSSPQTSRLRALVYQIDIFLFTVHFHLLWFIICYYDENKARLMQCML
jgi:hypothetical protein